MNDVPEMNVLRRYPLARRGFVMTSLISGFSLATQVVEAQAIHTYATGLDAGDKTQIATVVLAAKYNALVPVVGGTTLGMLLATINSSILLIALPDIFRGLHIDPLQAGNTNYLLWMILSFLVVTAVLVVSLGRLGDMFGRVRTYNLGFAVFTLFSILLFLTPLTGGAGALWVIGMRVRATAGEWGSSGLTWVRAGRAGGRLAGRTIASIRGCPAASPVVISMT